MRVLKALALLAPVVLAGGCTQQVGLNYAPPEKVSFESRPMVAAVTATDQRREAPNRLATIMGTPYEVDTRGRIFFIEDVGEEPYAMDRMLTQMRLAGKLDQAAGIVFGECSRCTPKDYKPGFDNNLSLGEVVDEILGKLRIPVLAGLTIGHTADQLTLPLGVAATLDADAGTLTITESATS